MDKHYDIAIIGGGINGTGIARDAAGRDLRVLLLEKGDLASATSSASSKLVHGGLRYLEQGEFKLVKEALQEREILLHLAPHIVEPREFILPVGEYSRNRFWIRLGLWFYDKLAKRKALGASRHLRLPDSPHYGAPLKTSLKHGFAYFDCAVDDARLVVINAMDARARGADIRTYTALQKAERRSGRWHLSLITGEQVTADILVNAAGPWVEDVLGKVGSRSVSKVKWVRGSHIVVPKRYEGNHAYILQAPDGRVVFLLPFEGEYTLVGTTDAEQFELSRPECTAEEQEYLMRVANYYLNTPIQPEDIVWKFAGTRALYDDGKKNPAKVTREYVLELEAHKGEAPLLSVFGGKLTTYRSLAEEALAKLQPYLPPKAKLTWTRTAPLPGGGRKPHLPRWLPEHLVQRWKRTYGAKAERIVGEAAGMDDLGREVAPNIYEAEMRYAMRDEFCHTAEDFLWRRTKLGLGLTAKQRAAVLAWFEGARSP